MPRPDRLITHNGKTQTVTEWANELGLKITTLFKRLDRGWSVEKALGSGLTDPHASHDWSTSIDLTGQRFGMLVVLERAGTTNREETGCCWATWRCRCDCGVEKVYPSNWLRGNRVQSCGCERPKLTAERFRTHGATVGYEVTDEYRIWSAMHTRCYNPNSHKYASYGGRGIVIVERWHRDNPDGFANFRSDMGPRPSKKHSIERADNDGPYSPENCHWATQLEQTHNTRRNRYLTANGKRMILADWVRETGLRYACIVTRLRHGWSDEEAVNTPVGGCRGGQPHKDDQR